MDSASLIAVSSRCHTTVAVTGSGVSGYASPLEAFDNLTHALPGVFRSMFSYPQGVIKSSLKWGSCERKLLTLLKEGNIQW